MALLEDAAELATTAEADAVFAYLEASAPWLKRAIAQHNAARFSTLRICNLLLRRLSKASAASLCGRAAPCAHQLADFCRNMPALITLRWDSVRRWGQVVPEKPSFGQKEQAGAPVPTKHPSPQELPSSCGKAVLCNRGSHSCSLRRSNCGDQGDL